MSFLDWVGFRLNELGFSQRDLAREAGLSEVTISNIRRGVHRASPISRNKIFEVIGEMPEDWQQAQRELEAQEADIDEPEEIPERVEDDGVGEISEHNPHDQNDWPQGGGIYVFFDRSGRPMYVGESGDIQRRLRNYVNDDRGVHWMRMPIVSSMHFIPIIDLRIRRAVEKAMIRSMSRVLLFNRNHIDRELDND